MTQPIKLSIEDLTPTILVNLKNKIEHGVSYLLINKNNELMLTTNHKYQNGAGVYLKYSANGIDKSLYGNETEWIMTMTEFNNATEKRVTKGME